MKKVYLNISPKGNNIHSVTLKFRNLSAKIDELLNSGKFWAFSQNQQAKMLAKLRSLFEKLSGFNPKYALKIAGTAMCFTLIAGTANGQSFQEWTPDTSPISFNTITPNNGNIQSEYEIRDGVFVDIDNDGDLDAFILTESGPIFFENVNGVYTENLLDNPFTQCCGDFIAGRGTGIDIADFDGDGDLDAILIDGYSSGRLIHYQMQSNGKFEYVSGSPINNGSGGSPLYLWSGSKAKFADVDGDGDLDIIGTSYCGTIASYLQQSDNSFTYSSNYPLNSIGIFNSLQYVHINLVDMDGDGDDDLFIFERQLEAGSPALADATANIKYYENTGSGSFSLNTSAALLPLSQMSDEHFPLLADLDGDGDIDVFIPGGSSGAGQTAFQNLANGPVVPVSPFVALLAFAAAGFGIIRKNRKKKVE